MKIKKLKFINHKEGSFFDYLLCKGYKDSSAMHYIRRLRTIDNIDTLLENIDFYIDDYENGSNKSINTSSHTAYSCALKRLKECALNRGWII